MNISSLQKRSTKHWKTRIGSNYETNTIKEEQCREP
jgi:hypothetical protein